MDAFIRANERNQPFIDGGLFSMSLLNALEFEGLGACALNAMMDKKTEERIFEILKIKSNDRLIMFISVGNFKNEVKVPVSLRNNLEDIINIIN